MEMAAWLVYRVEWEMGMRTAHRASPTVPFGR